MTDILYPVPLLNFSPFVLSKNRSKIMLRPSAITCSCPLLDSHFVTFCATSGPLTASIQSFSVFFRRGLFRCFSSSLSNLHVMQRGSVILIVAVRGDLALLVPALPSATFRVFSRFLGEAAPGRVSSYSYSKCTPSAPSLSA